MFEYFLINIAQCLLAELVLIALPVFTFWLVLHIADRKNEKK